MWLAHDAHHQRLVALKVLTAESSKDAHEIALLKYLDQRNPDGRAAITALLDDFTIAGINGTHKCLVSQFAGPSLSTITDNAGQGLGTQRLRGPLVRKTRETSDGSSYGTAFCQHHPWR